MLQRYDAERDVAQWKFDLERDEVQRKFIAAMLGVKLDDGPTKNSKPKPGRTGKSAPAVERLASQASGDNHYKTSMTAQDIMRNYKK